LSAEPVTQHSVFFVTYELGLKT